MNSELIEYLEEKYEELKWELSITQDETVKKDVEQDLNDTFQTLQTFKKLITKEEFIPWTPL